MERLIRKRLLSIGKCLLPIWTSPSTIPEEANHCGFVKQLLVLMDTNQDERISKREPDRAKPKERVMVSRFGKTWDPHPAPFNCWRASPFWERESSLPLNSPRLDRTLPAEASLP